MRETPGWPAAMRRTTAANYLDLSVPEFEREVAAGRMRSAIMLGNAGHWVRTAIDERLGDMIGATKRDWRKDQPAYQDAGMWIGAESGTPANFGRERFGSLGRWICALVNMASPECCAI